MIEFNQKELNKLAKVLNQISNFVLSEIQKNGISSVIDISTKHMFRDKFERISIKDSLLVSMNLDYDISEMAIEIITPDDVLEVHYHNDAYAVITILGEMEGTEEPEGAVFYSGSKDQPYPAITGVTLQILPGMLHGFVTPKGAKPLAFLSVQSKRINEDFHVV